MGTNINKFSYFQRAKGQALQSQKSLQTQVNRHSTYSVTNGTQMTTSQTRFFQPDSALKSQTDGKMGTMKASKLEQSSAYVHLVFFVFFPGKGYRGKLYSCTICFPAVCK